MAPREGHQLQLLIELGSVNFRARACFGSVYKECERSEGKNGYARGLTADCSGCDRVPSAGALELAVSTLPKRKTY
jgi:hypothetical protein